MKETLATTLRDTTNMNARNNNNRIHNRQDNSIPEDEPKPMLPNPYDHHDDHHEEEENEKEDGEEEEEKVEDDQTQEPHRRHRKRQQRKMPSGCMGAYSRAIRSATEGIVDIVKQGRRAKFATMNTSEQARHVSTLLDACSLNEGLATVQELSTIMDLDAFYVGSDGSETCALHTAAFHGAHQVVEYLLQGILDEDDKHDDNNNDGLAPKQLDGGLCLVDCQDSNGWTALHFAAGSNSVECVQVLAKHGAKLSLEANNGYSPLQWARRLSNDEVEETLMELLQNDYYSKRNHHYYYYYGWRTQPLTSLANRFFSLIPSR